MSIYNGFGTRNQETTYNKLLYNLAFLLQHSLIKLLMKLNLEENSEIFQPDEFNETSFKKNFIKLVTKLKALEQYKYLPPKFS